MTASVLLVPITAFIDDYLSSATLFEGFTQATEQSCFRGAQRIAMVYLGSVALYFFALSLALVAVIIRAEVLIIQNYLKSDLVSLSF